MDNTAPGGMNLTWLPEGDVSTSLANNAVDGFYSGKPFRRKGF